MLHEKRGIKEKMANIKINGIVLSESNMGDFDKMLTILTPNIRKNFMYSQRSEKTKKCSFGRNPNVLFW